MSVQLQHLWTNQSRSKSLGLFSWESVVFQNWNVSQETVHSAKVKKLQECREKLWKEVFLFSERQTLICFVSNWDNKSETSSTPMGLAVPFPGQRFSQPLLIGSWLCCAFQDAWLSVGTQRRLERWSGKLAFLGCQVEFLQSQYAQEEDEVFVSGFWFSAFYCFQSYGQLPEHCLGDLRLFVSFCFWSEPCNTEFTFPLIAFNM